MRGVPRWLAVLAVVAVVTMVCAFTVHRVLIPAGLLIQSSQSALPADGFTSTEIIVHSSTGRDLRGLRAEVDDSHRAMVESVSTTSDSVMVKVSSGVLPGETRLRLIVSGIEPKDVALRMTLDVSDSLGTALLTSCASTIRLIAQLFAGGSPCWRKRSFTGITPRLLRSTIVRHCFVTLIARLYASTTPPGRRPWPYLSHLRPTMFASINIRTPRWVQDYFAFATAASRPVILAMAHSLNLPMPRRSGVITPTL